MIMNIREAKEEDIHQIQVVRNSVKENTLSDPSLVTDKDCEEFLFGKGKCWVCEIDLDSHRIFSAQSELFTVY